MCNRRDDSDQERGPAMPGRRDVIMTGAGLAVTTLAGLASASAQADQPSGNIARAGSLPSAKGPAENFTGSVRVDPLFRAKAPSRTSGSVVTFEPGARTAWHTHPLGQILVVTFGCGLVQNWGGPIEEIRPGDVVWCPPGEKHWHGATAATAMTHIAIVEQLNGVAVNWMEKVSDEEYFAYQKRR